MVDKVKAGGKRKRIDWNDKIIPLAALFIAALAILSPIIINKIAAPKFYVSSFISNNTLYLSVYNGGLKEGIIHSAGYCYYDHHKRQCKNGTLRNFFDLKIIGSKEGEVFEIKNGIDKQSLHQKYQDSGGGRWAIILCQIEKDCNTYVSKELPGCLEERSFILNREIMNLPKFTSTFKEEIEPFERIVGVSIDPEFQC